MNGEPQKGSYALLGSTLGAQMLRMLIDHKGEISFRSVEKVEAWETSTKRSEKVATWSIVSHHQETQFSLL